MEKYLIDTNVVSYYLDATLPENGLRLMNKIIDAIPIMSIITQIEILCWSVEKSKEEKIKKFISESTIMNITPEIVLHCVTLRKMRKIKTPDAIIGATALANNCILVTTNKSDFINIRGLKVIDPLKL